MQLTFLSTDVPLTKTITKLKDGSLNKESYPCRKFFTSETIPVNNLNELFKAIKDKSTAPDKPCMLKGIIKKALVNEPRALATKSETKTQFAVFDLDRAPFNNPDEFMKAIGLDDISHIVQYSASHKLDHNDKTLSCHLFVWLSEPRSAPELKAWLMHLNLTVPTLKDALSLTKAYHALHWPLDITVCQNDKLIYIAEPTFINMTRPIPTQERVQLVIKKQAELSITKIALHPMDALKKQARTVLNRLRTEAGMEPLRKTTVEGEFTVQKGVGEITHYEVFNDHPDFVRFNFNGGDSKAYYHPRGNIELIHSFKGEDAMLTKEILPTYYNEQRREKNISNRTPNEGGEVLLAFREKVTAKYWKGTWAPETKHLDINMVTDKGMLEDFCKSHGTTLGDFAPEWKIEFNPQNPIICDEENHILNTFEPSHYMHPENQLNTTFPCIEDVLYSAVGANEVYEHFLDWLAYIFQTRQKPQVAWILHGTYGTGKGLLINKILMPLFGKKQVYIIRASELNEQFNGWMENSLIVFVDEIDADMFTNPKGLESNLKNYITEPAATIRKMRTNAYMVENHTAFIFASNQPQPVHIPLEDRRFNVASYQVERYHPKDTTIKGIESEKELSAFAYHLQHRATSAEKARTILHTEERANMQKLGLTGIDIVARTISTGQLSELLEALPDDNALNDHQNGGYTAANYRDLVRRFAQETESKITRDELRTLFKHCTGLPLEGAAKFNCMLRHHGINTKRIRAGDELFYGIIVNWITTDEDKEYLAKRYPLKGAKLKVVKE